MQINHCQKSEEYQRGSYSQPRKKLYLFYNRVVYHKKKSLTNAAIRGMRDHNRFVEKRKAAIALQSGEEFAAHGSPAAMRSKVLKQRLARLRRNVRKVQATVQMAHARRRFLRRRKAALYFQAGKGYPFSLIVQKSSDILC